MQYWTEDYDIILAMQKYNNECHVMMHEMQQWIQCIKLNGRPGDSSYTQAIPNFKKCQD